MSENTKFYKNLSKASDFIVLLSSNIIPIINGKISQHTTELSEFINTSNIIGLKKKHLNWNEIMKNYTTLTTAVNNLIGFNHTINYARKMLLKELERTKTPDYVQRKIKTIENSCIKFIEYTQVLLRCLDYFAKTMDLSGKSVSRPDFKSKGESDIKSEEKSETKVEEKAEGSAEKKGDNLQNLSDVYQLITKAIETFDKKHFSKIKQINADILAHLTKEGKGELEQICTIGQDLVQSVKDFAIQGGFEQSDCYQVIIGGTGDETKKVMIGGFHAENYVKEQFIQYQLLKKDVDALAEEPKEGEKIQEKIQTYYQNFIEQLKPYQNLSKLNIDQLTRDFLTKSGILTNINKQITEIATIDLPKLLDYHVKRFKSTQTQTE